jgi:hypothetical protein
MCRLKYASAQIVGIVCQVLAKQGKEWAKPEAGDVGAGRSRAMERSGEGKERKAAEERKPAATEPTAEPEA